MDVVDLRAPANRAHTKTAHRDRATDAERQRVGQDTRGGASAIETAFNVAPKGSTLDVGHARTDDHVSVASRYVHEQDAAIRDREAAVRGVAGASDRYRDAQLARRPKDGQHVLFTRRLDDDIGHASDRTRHSLCRTQQGMVES